MNYNPFIINVSKSFTLMEIHWKNIRWCFLFTQCENILHRLSLNRHRFLKRSFPHGKKFLNNRIQNRGAKKVLEGEWRVKTDFMKFISYDILIRAHEENSWGGCNVSEGGIFTLFPAAAHSTNSLKLLIAWRLVLHNESEFHRQKRHYMREKRWVYFTTFQWLHYQLFHIISACQTKRPRKNRGLIYLELYWAFAFCLSHITFINISFQEDIFPKSLPLPMYFRARYNRLLKVFPLLLFAILHDELIPERFTVSQLISFSISLISLNFIIHQI